MVHKMGEFAELCKAENEDRRGRNDQVLFSKKNVAITQTS